MATRMRAEMRLLNRLQSMEWGNPSFYVVKLIQHRADYNVLHVNIDKRLQRTLKKAILKQIRDANRVTEYDYNTADLDNNLLSINLGEINFAPGFDKVSQLIENRQFDHVRQYEDILGARFYVALLQSKAEENPLFAVRRISDSWTTKKVFQMLNLIFMDNKLIDLDQKEIFRIDDKFDFFAFRDIIFIANKKNFEHSLNFREGMIRNRDSIVEEFGELEIFQNAEEVGRLVGDKMNRLRRLAQVKNAGYYKDADFLRNLRRENAERNWGIEFSSNGKIIADENTIDIILHALNDNLLTSSVTSTDYKVEVKRKM